MREALQKQIDEKNKKKEEEKQRLKQLDMIEEQKTGQYDIP